MNYDQEKPVQCAYKAETAKNTSLEQSRPFFARDTVSGRRVSGRYATRILGSGRTTRLYLVAVVHIAGIPSETGGLKPIVNQEWVDKVFSRANEIWSQACVELVPYHTGTTNTSFGDLPVTGFIGCLDSKGLDLVKPYDITSPTTKIINLYFVDFSNGLACGDPATGHVILPTQRGLLDAENMGRVFAHEIGHVLLNSLGVDDSPNPDHLMFHATSHPEISPGSVDGLFLSDCLGARTRAKEALFSYASPGLPNTSEQANTCWMKPKLGNNLFIGATDFALAQD